MHDKNVSSKKFLMSMNVTQAPLIELIEEKGLFTKEELMEKLQ